MEPWSGRMGNRLLNRKTCTLEMKVLVLVEGQILETKDSLLAP